MPPRSSQKGNKENLSRPGLEAYEKALEIAPDNPVAKRQADSLRKRITSEASAKPDPEQS